ncbi:response regulator transcription factor [Anaerofilum hominis]|uniref:response regulator transcription factor n=1 Tax=Anaerofilum hominis TaxID=2763016 RepID=UPI00311AAEA5
MEILLVEDEAAIAAPLASLLRAEGWRVAVCGTVRAALAQLEDGRPDAVLVDLGLPDGDGAEVCRAARRAGDASVVILTARGDEASVVRGLEQGADDYVTKPFRSRELISRLRAVQRRRSPAADRLGSLQIDRQAAQVRREGRLLPLTAQEYRLLMVFAAHPGQLLERGRLLQALWDQGGSFVNDNTLTVTVKRLREKIDGPGAPRIATVRGMGYRLEVEEDA